jgi:hypothetical protein
MLVAVTDTPLIVLSPKLGPESPTKFEAVIVKSNWLGVTFHEDVPNAPYVPTPGGLVPVQLAIFADRLIPLAFTVSVKVFPVVALVADHIPVISPTTPLLRVQVRLPGHIMVVADIPTPEKV